MMPQFLSTFIGLRHRPDIVGYSQIPSIAKGKFVALAVQFEKTDGTAIPVKDLVSLASPSGSASIGAGADQIWRWNTAAADWDKYFYRSGRGVTNPGWTQSGETAPTADVIPMGEGFFFSRAGDAVTITFTKPAEEGLCARQRVVRIKQTKAKETNNEKANNSSFGHDDGVCCQCWKLCVGVQQ